MGTRDLVKLLESNPELKAKVEREAERQQKADAEAKRRQLREDVAARLQGCLDGVDMAALDGLRFTVTFTDGNVGITDSSGGRRTGGGNGGRPVVVDGVPYESASAWAKATGRDKPYSVNYHEVLEREAKAGKVSLG